MAKGAFLDAGDYYGRDDTVDVPATVVADARRQLTEHRNQYGRGTWPTPHRHCGTSQDRQWIGRPGHCSVCAVVGHVVAHPEYGCSDVGCDDPHAEVAALGPVRESALSPEGDGGLGAGEETLGRVCGALAAIGYGLDRVAERVISWAVRF